MRGRRRRHSRRSRRADSLHHTCVRWRVIGRGWGMGVGDEPAVSSSSTIDEWPSQRSGCSYGGTYAAAGSASTTDRASASASFQFDPCTSTSAPCAEILSSMIFFVVVGTITRTRTPSRRPIAAAAWPALPPDDETTLVTPSRCICAHMYAMPRSLNDPLGCIDSILSQTLVPVRSLSGRDWTSGVLMVRPGGICTYRPGTAAAADMRTAARSQLARPRICRCRGPSRPGFDRYAVRRG